MTDMRGTSLQNAITGVTPEPQQRTQHHTPGTPHTGGVQHGKFKEGTDEYRWNLDGPFKARLERFLADNPHNAELLSGYRDPSHQARLAADAQRKHGENWRRWAAAPGKSNHNKGLAADLHYLNDAAKEWAHANAARYGLEFPMGWEPWHVEPLGLRSGVYELKEDFDFTDSYTVPPTGFADPAQPQSADLERSVALIDTLLSGALPPANAIEEAPEVITGHHGDSSLNTLLEGPGALMDAIKPTDVADDPVGGPS